jgi:CHAT domain-containing protein
MATCIERKLLPGWIFFFMIAGTIYIMGQVVKQVNPVTTPVDSLYLYMKDTGGQATDYAAWLDERRSFIGNAPVMRYQYYEAMAAGLQRKPRKDNGDEGSAYFSYLIQYAYDALKVKGWVPESMELYEQALQFYEQNKAIVDYDEDFIAGYLLTPLGNIYTRLGDFNSALFTHQKIIQYATENKDSLLLASSYGNLAVAYRWSDSLQLAYSAVEKGLALVKDSLSYTYIYLTGVKAELQQLQQEPAAASGNNNKAIARYTALLNQAPNEEKSRLAEGLSACYRVKAKLEEQAGQINAAGRAYETALQILQQYFPNALRREKGMALANIAYNFLQQKKHNDAIVYYDKALLQLIPSYKNDHFYPEMSDAVVDNLIIEAISGKAECALAKNNVSLALEGMLQASGLEQQLRRKFLTVQSKYNQNVFSRQRTEKILKIAVAQWQKTKDQKLARSIVEQIERSKAQVLYEAREKNSKLYSQPEDSLSIARKRLVNNIQYYRQWLAENTKDTADIDRTKQKIAGLEYSLALFDNQMKTDHQFAATAFAVTDSAAQWLGLIGDKQLVLNYFAGNTDVYITALVKDSVKEVFVLQNAAAIKDSVITYLEKYYYNGAAAMQEESAVFCRRSHDLYNTLLPAVNWNSYQSVIILPDEYLYQLPFEALQTKTTTATNPGAWPYLLQQTVVGYAFSLSLWQQQVMSDTAKQTTAKVYGYFVSEFDGAYPDLPQIKNEAKSLNKQTLTKAYINSTATKHSFEKRLTSNNILHVSTHNIELENGDVALVFADSLLYQWHVQFLQVKSPLIVLNACKGATGRLRQGEGVMSMGRFFTASGAKAVIASLWNVNDETGAAFVPDFYANMVRLQNPVTALQTTKINWLQNTANRPVAKLPYYWAGLSYIGAWQQLDIETQTTPWYQYLIAVIAVVLVLTGLVLYKNKRAKRILAKETTKTGQL